MRESEYCTQTDYVRYIPVRYKESLLYEYSCSVAAYREIDLLGN
jgi:hypothetical protein